MPKKGSITRKWYVLDAEGKVLGRLAARVASLLIGKHKPIYAPHVDVGDHVVVINAAKVHLTGQKRTDKVYRRHSGYIGGLREVTAETMLKRQPARVVEWAVSGMLPKTKLGRAMAKKLKVYGGSEHPHAAQRPEVLEFSRTPAKRPKES
jgi:large subunit ribosomal protein L13